MTMQASAVQWRSTEGCRTAVVFEGREHLHAIVIDYPVRAIKVPKAEQRRMTPLDGMTTAQAVRKYLSAGKRMGITEHAKELLKGAVS